MTRRSISGGVWAIYRYELARTVRTIWQSVATPVITTALYFVVFGGAIGSRIHEVGGVGYGAFIVPGPDHAVAPDPEHLERLDRHLLSRNSPARSSRSCRRRCRPIEVVAAYVGAAATKSVVIGLIILATATLFVRRAHRPSRSGWSPSSS